jgi:SAM-dependent methyltransferase
MTILQLGSGRKKTLASLGFRMTAPDGTPYDDLSQVKLLNLDMLPQTEPDVLCELGKDPISLPDDSVDLVIALHVLEHIGYQGEIGPWFYFWQELYRVLKPNGIVTFECPYYSSLWAWADPTHTRAISEMTFLYLNQDAYSAPHTAMPDYRPEFDFVQAEALSIIPDHTNANVREREAVSFIKGRLVARKPLVRYWEPVL